MREIPLDDYNRALPQRTGWHRRGEQSNGVGVRAMEMVKF
jgi:hypothetical protein